LAFKEHSLEITESYSLLECRGIKVVLRVKVSFHIGKARVYLSDFNANLARMLKVRGIEARHWRELIGLKGLVCLPEKKQSVGRFEINSLGC